MNLPRALAAWLLIILAESVHGMIRQAFIAPLIGELPARQVGVLIGSVLILAIAWMCIRWIGPRSFGQQFAVGLIWVVLTALFEFGLGTALGYTRERMLADYKLAEGGWMGLGMLVMLFAPALAARVRGLG